MNNISLQNGKKIAEYLNTLTGDEYGSYYNNLNVKQREDLYEYWSYQREIEEAEYNNEESCREAIRMLNKQRSERDKANQWSGWMWLLIILCSIPTGFTLFAGAVLFQWFQGQQVQKWYEAEVRQQIKTVHGITGNI